MLFWLSGLIFKVCWYFCVYRYYFIVSLGWVGGLKFFFFNSDFEKIKNLNIKWGFVKFWCVDNNRGLVIFVWFFMCEKWLSFFVSVNLEVSWIMF